MTPVREEAVPIVQEAFKRSPQKSVQCASAELNIPPSMVRRILKVKLHEHAYKIQVVQMLPEEDYHARLDFCQQMVSKIANSCEFLDELMFSDEAAFRISGKVNRHSSRIWGKEKLQEVWQREKDSPKLMSGAQSGSHALLVPSFLKKQQSMVNVIVQCCRISSTLNYDV
jgi:hypothetical protein